MRKDPMPRPPAHAGPAITEITTAKGEVCRDILAALPEWFGRPDAVRGIVEELPMFGCMAGDGVVGFVALKPQTGAAVEVYLLGLKKEWHGQGLGRRLIARAEDYARANGARFLSVKTMAASRAEPWYEQTRRFYEAVGFAPIEELPTPWGIDNRCLLMVKALG